MDRMAAEALLLSKGWLSQQPKAVQTALIRHARLEQFQPGTYAYRIDDPAGGIYGIACGALAIHVASAHSGPSLAHIVRSGAWIGHASNTRGTRRTVSAQAVAPTLALYVPLDALQRLSADSRGFAGALERLSQDALRTAAAVASDLLIRKVDRRIAATLLRVTGTLDGKPPDDVPGFRLTQAELGEMANASRHVVNRTLGRFSAAGWIVCGYHHIAIRKPHALAAFVRDADE